MPCQRADSADRSAARPSSFGYRPGIGLPQGSPLSPALANLVLEHVDDRLQRAGYPVVRYGNDMTIFATSRNDALEAGRVTSAAGAIGMALGADKTDAMSFEDGFCFLGEDFGIRYPPVIEDRIDVLEERTVFVGAAGSRVRIDEAGSSSNATTKSCSTCPRASWHASCASVRSE